MVHLKISRYSNFEEISRLIPKKINVYSYISKVSDGVSDYYQLLFADKDKYDGTCISAAHEFHGKLLQAGLDKYHLISAKLMLSGVPYYDKSQAKTTLIIIFATLLGTVAVLSLIFFVYVGPGRIYLLNRRAYNFARFENKAGGGISFGDRESITGSVVALDTSFENPLYGKESSREMRTMEEFEEDNFNDMSDFEEEFDFHKGEECDFRESKSSANIIESNLTEFDIVSADTIGTSKNSVENETMNYSEHTDFVEE